MTQAAVSWAVAAAGGGLVAVLYFAGLWWTVRRAPRARHPLVLIAGSFVLRAALAALALVGAAGEAPDLLAALAGFLVVRIALVRLARAGPSRVSARALPGER